MLSIENRVTLWKTVINVTMFMDTCVHNSLASTTNEQTFILEIQKQTKKKCFPVIVCKIMFLIGSKASATTQ